MTGYEYQVGGSLRQDAPSYLARQADLDLYTALNAGKLCYVFNSRQMGKSSLRVRTMQRLQGAGVRCGVIDMTLIGTQTTTPEQWYASIAAALASSFELTLNIGDWWRSHAYLSLTSRLGAFIETVLLAQVSQRIVVFLDELDSVLSLSFPVDDFFALVRYCHDRQADHVDYTRLTWAMFGVATPGDLISDHTRTPFNIGKAIELQGFKEHEALPLTKGLIGKVNNPQAVLRAILTWTSGQPFLTQKLCALVVQASQSTRQSQLILPPGTEPFWVEQLVQSHVLQQWESQDEPEHLRTIRDRILQNPAQAVQLLGLYRSILQTDPATADDSPNLPRSERMSPQGNHISSPPTKPHFTAQSLSQTAVLTHILADSSTLQTTLILSGLVTKQQGTLQIKNPIYRKIFTAAWVEKQLNHFCPFMPSLTAWIATEGQDQSCLLQGEALQVAQHWSQDQVLSQIAQQFLVASQEHDRALQAKFAAEHSQSQITYLQKEIHRLTLHLEHSRQQKRWLTLTNILLIIALIFCLILCLR
jgi:AAA-like domain